VKGGLPQKQVQQDHGTVKRVTEECLLPFEIRAIKATRFKKGNQKNESYPNLFREKRKQESKRGQEYKPEFTLFQVKKMKGHCQREKSESHEIRPA